MADRDGVIWYDGKLVPWRSATTHVLTHSLHYGLTVFEGLRAYDTVNGTAIFRLKEHTQRLLNSAHIYMMKIPYDRDTIMAAHKEVVRANKLESCYIRPIAFYGSEKMGVSPKGATVHVAIAAWPWGAYLGPEALAHRALGHGHADRVREPLTERTRGYLDPRRVVHLGVAGGGRTPLAERAKVVELEPVPVEVQHRIEQDRGVADGQHETVAIGPVGIAGVVFHHPCPQDMGQGGERHGGALVARTGGVGAVHGEAPHHVDGSLVRLRRSHIEHLTRAIGR